MAAGDDPRELWFDVGDGVQLHGLGWGSTSSGPIVLLLHGVAGNAWAWGALAPLLAERLPGHRIVALDQRGQGDSDKPMDGHEPPTFAQDIKAVCQELGGESAALVGHSRGGWLGAYVAGALPDLVSHLVLVDPARIMFDTTSDADGFYERVAALQGPFSSEEQALEFAEQDSPAAVWSADRKKAFLMGLERQDDGQLVGKTTLDILTELRRVRESQDWVGPVLDDIQAPTLLIAALMASAERINQKLEYARRIADVDCRALNATHYIALDKPDEVCDMVSSFIA